MATAQVECSQAVLLLLLEMLGSSQCRGVLHAMHYGR
jgi:hypothetical protein